MRKEAGNDDGECQSDQGGRGHDDVQDIHDAARPEDRDYFRRTREQRLKGATLEEFVANRASRLPALRDALMPLRRSSRVFHIWEAAHQILPTTSRSERSSG